MKLFDNLDISFQFWQDGLWHDIDEAFLSPAGLRAALPEGTFEASLTPAGGDMIEYEMKIAASLPSKLRMTLRASLNVKPFHLIPCCLHGDNNADVVRPGEFPLLTDKYPGTRFCSPVWEFRADRAAMPVSILWGEGRCFGASIEPYAEAGGANVRCGVFAELPASFGVTLGYTNRPVTFVNKQIDGQTVGDSAREATVRGRIYGFAAVNHTGAHRIIREEYARRQDQGKPTYKRTFREAADGLFDTFVGLNWSAERGEYTNRCCRPSDWLTMRPWRSVTEIGWTGGAVLALPMLMYERLTPGFTPARYKGARTAEEMFDCICSRYNEDSGMICDLMTPNDEGSDVNGWWTGYGLVKDCHCAYNSGTAAYSLLYAVDFLRSRGEDAPALWLSTAAKVVQTACDLQRPDGAFGYTYALDRREVLDWEGFAGCWFAAAAALLYKLTGEYRWIDSALKALRYYARDVRALNCWGTPMDTWKAVDQEGNLAFIRACRILYDETGNAEVLKLFRLGAEYEYLWRFGYKTRPEHAPIRDGWSSRGGSVTSVSNPHIHPMGALVNTDLYALADITGDDYHRARAEDGVAWLMQTLELYPDKTGYGQYGVLSERWCPSDGLLTERYADGGMYSSWFSYNLWAAADALQCVCERLAAGKA